jgi:endonuclease YncB( thermonuclease family)
MPPKFKKNDNNAPKQSHNPFSSGKLLLLFVAISVGQYAYTGSVSWITDSFRWVETSARSVTNNPGASIERAGGAIKGTAGQANRSTSNAEAANRGNAEISWSEPAFKLSGRVSKVADGDTITLIDAQRKKHKIRLFGIDSPESDQPYYNAAKNALSKLVDGKSVGVDVKDTDKYGRVVGTVFVEGRNVNLEMVKLGYAWWYEYYAPLNGDLREAQEHARAYKSGLWADSKPTAPWDWRRRTRR